MLCRRIAPLVPKGRAPALLAAVCRPDLPHEASAAQGQFQFPLVGLNEHLFAESERWRLLLATVLPLDPRLGLRVGLDVDLFVRHPEAVQVIAGSRRVFAPVGPVHAHVCTAHDSLLSRRALMWADDSPYTPRRHRITRELPDPMPATEASRGVRRAMYGSPLTGPRSGMTRGRTHGATD